MKVRNSTVLVTGANRGIGLALVEQSLEKGVAKVYATLPVRGKPFNA